MAPLHPDLPGGSLLPTATKILELLDDSTTTIIPTRTINPRDDGDTIHTPSGTIAPYATGLNGVDQPMNMLFMRALWWTLGALSIFILVIRIAEIAWSHLRRISAMTTSRSDHDHQGYWKHAQSRLTPIFKRHLTYAPLFNKRHTREMRLSAANALSFGTVPARLEVFFLVFYLVSNLIYTFRVDWSQPNKYALAAEVRGRAGTLALVNMVPLVLFATRNNPLIAILKISFDLFNLVHRWMGRIVVLEIAIHTGAWAYVQVHVGEGGWHSIGDKIFHHVFEGSGALGTLAMLILLVLSFSPLRHAFYETFLTTHIILAALIMGMAWVHCSSANVVGGLPQLPWVYAIVGLWIFERLARWVRLAYCNWAIQGKFTKAVVEALPGDATRVTLYLPKRMHIDPGTHAYLRFAGIRPWESHPFSIAWVEHKNHERFSSDGSNDVEKQQQQQQQQNPPPHQRQHSSQQTLLQLPQLPNNDTAHSSPCVSRPVTPDISITCSEGLLTGSPCSGAIAEYEGIPRGSSDDGDSVSSSSSPATTTAVSFLIGAQTGFTRQLYRHAQQQSQSSNKSVRIPAALEGPYAGHNDLSSYGHAVLFAGSTGITHQLSYLQPLIRGYQTRSVATRRLKLVWVVRTVECLDWIRPWLEKVGEMEGAGQLVDFVVYVTRLDGESFVLPLGGDEAAGNGMRIRVKKGRPDVGGILEGEVGAKQVGAMAVTVCGPGGLADDVRLAVRKAQGRGTVVDFVEESFTW